MNQKTRSHDIKKALAWRKNYYYDKEAADRVIRFFHKHIRHTKGKFANKPFILERWQRYIVRRLFGWKRRDNHTRKFRTLFLFLPRKNGKSTFGAGLALYLLHADGEMGAEVVSAAADAEQADIIFSMAKEMNDADPLLSRRGKSFRRSLVVYETGSNYKVISSVAGTKHGKNLHGILFDELHAQEDRELYDVLRTSVVAREQPLEIYMTTAGYDPLSICYEVYEYAKKVADGTYDDPTFMPVIFEAGPEDDWTLEATWKKANPNYGVSISPTYYETKVKEALNKPAFENALRRLHLNQWTNQDVRAISMLKWKECGAKYKFEKDLWKGRRVWLGLDLSSKNDLTAAALLFNHENIWHACVEFWCPEDTVKERKAKGKPEFDQWVKQGWLRTCPGGRIEYDYIRKWINETAKQCDLAEVAVDPYNAYQLSTQLEKEDGLEVVHVRQGMFTLSDPTKELISLIGDVQFAHGNNPLLTWCAGYLATEEDAAGNLKPSKKKSKERIDGIAAIITGMARALVAENTETVYRTKEIEVW